MQLKTMIKTFSVKLEIWRTMLFIFSSICFYYHQRSNSYS